jgi:uncharacterized protein
VIVNTKDISTDGSFVLQLEKTLNEHWEGTYTLAGNSVFGAALADVIGRDLPILGGLCIITILAFLFLNFRSWQGVVLPFLTVILGVTWGLGFFGWVGGKLQALTIIGPIAVLAVGSSFALHLLGRLMFELAHGKSKQDAIRTTYTETGQGVLISGIAIAAAMLTFLLSHIEMVRGLGVLTAAGVMGCLIIAMVFLPAMLNVLPTPKVNLNPEAPGALGNGLRNLATWIGRNRVGVLIISAVLLIVAAIGATRIVPNTSVLAFFPKESRVIKGINKVEDTIGGSSNFTFLIEGDMQNPKLLEGMLKLHDEAKIIPGVGAGQSLATAIRTIHEILTGEAGLPDTKAKVAQELLTLSGSDFSRLVTLNYQKGLMTVSLKQLPTSETKIVVKKLEALAETHLRPHAKVTISGPAFINIATEEALLHDFIVSLTLAILLVIGIDSFVRSFRAAVITIASLVLTVAVQYGALGWLGIPLNLATMLMGALAIGVGDYAIHLTVRYLEELRAGHAPEAAMSEAMYTSGRSITFTALTLGGGFAALVFASFVPVSTLGMLMVFTVTIVGITSLTLLPAACLTFLRHFSPRTALTTQAAD